MNKIIDYQYYGPLADIIRQYVLYKRGTGLSFNTEAKKLKHFDNFNMTWDLPKNTLTKELSQAYTLKTENESINNQMYRVGVINRLANYMQNFGYEAYIQPTKILRRTTTTYIPYIFSKKEIRDIFNVLKLVTPNCHNRHQHLTVPLLFKILYCCGLRESEVINLTVGDVDLKNGVILIKQTKFCKERLIPLSKSVWEQCEIFSLALHIDSTGTDVYLPNAFNQAYSNKRVYDMFRELIFKAGISHGGVGKGPRVHDFRHTFAVHCLKTWSENDKDINVLLPYLSSYMGHTGIKSTQRYLRLTAELYPIITAKIISKFGEIIPTLGGHNES